MTYCSTNTRCIFHALVALVVFAFAFPAYALSPSDSLLGEQWYLDAIAAKDAWEVTIGNPASIIAVLDVGVDLDHPDLASAMWQNLGEIPGNGVDDDRNGYVDDVNGWDFVGNDNDPTPAYDVAGSNPNDLHHGTVVAGIIAARGNNGQGIAGIDWLAKIMPLRVLRSDGVGDLNDVLAALRYAHEQGASIVNLSFVGTERSVELDALIIELARDGVLVVAAGGNEDQRGRGNLDDFPAYPICSGNGEGYVLGVAATNEQDEKATFSSYGDCVDLSAPGSHIVGTRFHDPDHTAIAVGDRIGQTTFSEPYGGFFNGTSYAAPIVAGAASLVRGLLPSLAPLDIIALLRQAADPIANVPGALTGKLGAGRLQLSRAVREALARATAAPSMTHSSIEFSRPIVGVLEDVIVRVVVQNDSGQVLGGRSVRLLSDRIDDLIAPTTALTDATGIASFSIRAQQEGIAELHALIGDLTVATGRVVVASGGAAGIGIGSLLKGSTSSVYVVDARGKRYAFPDRQTFDSWYADTSSVLRVDDSVLAAFPLGGLVTIRPGTFLVKIQTDPKVYTVERGGVLRWVPTEEMAIARYGTAWASRVVDVPDAFFATYTSGTQVGPGEFPSGYLWEHPATGTRAMVENGTLRAFGTRELFAQNGLQERDVFRHLVVELPFGNPILGREQTLAIPIP